MHALPSVHTGFLLITPRIETLWRISWWNMEVGVYPHLRVSSGAWSSGQTGNSFVYLKVSRLRFSYTFKWRERLPVGGRRGVWKSRDRASDSRSARLSVTALEHRTRKVPAKKRPRKNVLFSDVDQIRACLECNVDYYALGYFFDENWGKSLSFLEGGGYRINDTSLGVISSWQVTLFLVLLCFFTFIYVTWRDIGNTLV